jgi:hypothetical protein
MYRVFIQKWLRRENGVLEICPWRNVMTVKSKQIAENYFADLRDQNDFDGQVKLVGPKGKVTIANTPQELDLPEQEEDDLELPSYGRELQAA